MTKIKKLSILLSALIVSSCASITPEQTNTIINTLIKSPSPSSNTTETKKENTGFKFEGIVRDQESGEPVADAEVEFNNLIVKTNINGYFEFNNIASGEYKLQIYKKGKYNDIQNIIITDSPKSVSYLLGFNDSPKIQPTPPTITTIKPIISNTSTPSPAINQGFIELTGTVRDIKSRENITSAIVRLGEYNTTTDSFGFFKINIKPGTYEINISKDKYFTKTEIITFDSSEILSINLNPIIIPTAIPTALPTLVPTLPPLSTPIPTAIPTPIGNSYDPKIDLINYLEPTIDTPNMLEPNNIELRFRLYDGPKSLSRNTIYWERGSIKFDYTIYENISEYQASQPKKGSIILTDSITFTNWKESKSLTFSDLKSYGRYFIIKTTAYLPNGKTITTEINTLI